MTNQINIRKAKQSELAKIMEIYAYARKIMKANGNATQWGNNRPDIATIQKDIEQQNAIHAVFAFVLGEDPTYRVIEDGQWQDNSEYGTIHRVASNGTIRGIFDLIMQFCEQKIKHIRIDTHKDNTIMQHLIEKHQFQRCGIIYVSDKTPRIAYEKSEKI